jgi:hypothetical protein
VVGDNARKVFPRRDNAAFDFENDVAAARPALAAFSCSDNLFPADVKE